MLISFVVLLAWVPLREKPGIGTIANAFVVGMAADATLLLLDRPDGLAARAGLLGRASSSTGSRPRSTSARSSAVDLAMA